MNILSSDEVYKLGFRLCVIFLSVGGFVSCFHDNATGSRIHKKLNRV